MNLQSGKTYRDSHGDSYTVELCPDAMFRSTDGSAFHSNGFRWNHVYGSAGNLIEEVPTAPTIAPSARTNETEE